MHRGHGGASRSGRCGSLVARGSSVWPAPPMLVRRRHGHGPRTERNHLVFSTPSLRAAGAQYKYRAGMCGASACAPSSAELACGSSAWVELAWAKPWT